MDKYLFWFISDVSLTIMFVLDHDFTDTPYKTIKEFRVKLVKDLTGDYKSRNEEDNHQEHHRVYVFAIIISL